MGTKPMRTLERILVDLDGAPWSAVSRIALGLALIPAFRLVTGDSDRMLLTILLFAGLLVALRVVPAVLRHALPFSAQAKAIWAERRQIAKQHDSYQWQKLFWIGLGLLPYALIGDGPRLNELAITAFCLIGGSAGLLLWRRVQAKPIPAQAPVAGAAQRF